MKTRIFLLLFFLCFLACKNVKQNKDEQFDRDKWATKNELDYPYRDQMIKDLIANQKLHGLKKDEVVHLLGEPDRTDNGHLFYLIKQDRLGYFPLHTKTLVIKLNRDSAVEWRKIHE
jgi:outer membrane protein assembly factor BamE (lipoprotein component of BamABCDE complex)